ncbi:uncharacterized protein FMAN_14004 [Fusarium mangiferae]|uniref:Zn(2)-C6 fungal-type domain-containing protein n=1 Tax=Fusarium mangiferae TaxID=192010 RepID=A0A1L7TLJ4_FUSMA|nr:uncharacterized protein FMAN_14004 [Fusarium mangiferae]CVK96121.1 uncharacterized protein FMAN_14004 [Fusarium mangiferae]
MRTASSCSVCRARKKRCIAGSSGETCQLCSRKGLRCDAPPPRTSTGNPQPIQAHVVSSGHPAILPPAEGSISCPLNDSPTSEGSIESQIVKTTLEDQDLCEELVGIYFDIIHFKQHLIFHPQSFIQDQKKGLVPDYLLLGVMALSARFSSNPSFDGTSPWERGKSFLQDAIRSFNERTKLISLEALQGCILLAFGAFVEGDADQDALLTCQAIRMAQSQGLPANLSSDGLTREIQINLYWQTWMMDCWTSVRAELPQQLRNDPSFPRPLRQDLFDRLSPGGPADDSMVSDVSRVSIWGLILPLSHWHAEAVQLNHDIVNKPAAEFTVRQLVRGLASKLDHWVTGLPHNLRNTTENWKTYMHIGQGRLFAVMHVIYHHTCQLLFYQFLNRYALPEGQDVTALDEEAVTYANLCKAHAIALSKLMWELNSSPELDCLWSPVNSHLVVVASTIHLHTMLLGADRPEAKEAKRLLEQNFMILQELQKYWPSTEIALLRLQTFHNACRVSTISKTFDMDHWMANFLIRYDLSVQDRDIDVELASLGKNDDGTQIWDMVANDS